MILLFVVFSATGMLDDEYINKLFTSLKRSDSGMMLAAFLIIFLLLIDLLLPIPSSLVMGLSGSLFGIFNGMLLSLTGAMLTALTGYYICRVFGHRMFTRFIGEEDTTNIEQWFERYGVYAIIISRPIPMLTEVLSCLAGATKFSAGQFILSSLIGTIPVCLVYSISGATSSITNPFPLICTTLAIPALGWFITKQIKAKHRDHEK